MYKLHICQEYIHSYNYVLQRNVYAYTELHIPESQYTLLVIQLCTGKIALGKPVMDTQCLEQMIPSNQFYAWVERLNPSVASQKRIFTEYNSLTQVKKKILSLTQALHTYMYACTYVCIQIYIYMAIQLYVSKNITYKLQVSFQRLRCPVHLPTPILNHQIGWGTLAT